MAKPAAASTLATAARRLRLFWLASVTIELVKLQSDIPADPPEKVRETIQTELGKPPEELFAELDGKPLGSASIAQVHRARYPHGAAAKDKPVAWNDILTNLRDPDAQPTNEEFWKTVREAIEADRARYFGW